MNQVVRVGLALIAFVVLLALFVCVCGGAVTG